MAVWPGPRQALRQRYTQPHWLPLRPLLCGNRHHQGDRGQRQNLPPCLHNQEPRKPDGNVTNQICAFIEKLYQKKLLTSSPQVSWVRHGDTHLLTTGMYRYTPDKRFSSLHKPSSENWVLELRDSKPSDKGKTIYICS